MKKALSILVAAAMLCLLWCPIVGSIGCSAEESNLVVNGSFENGTTGWTVSNAGNEWNVSVDSYAGHANSGSNSLYVRHFWSQTSQTVTVEADSTYEYSFWYSRKAGGATTSVTIGSETITLTDTTGYTECTGTINSGSATELAIRINNNGGGGETYAYFDDFSLVKIVDPNLIVNGGFENGTTGWTVSNPGNDWNVAVDSYAGHANTGSNSLVVRQFWSYTTQTVTVEPNTDYIYSFWCKRTAEGATTTVSFGSETVTLGESADYVQYTGKVNSGSASSLVVAIYNNGGNATYTYLDDFRLEVDRSNVVINGGFESGTDNWTISHPGNDWNVAVDTYAGHANTGSNSLVVRQFWSYTTQTVSVEPNTNYLYTFWCKRTAAGATTTVSFGSETVTLGESADYVKYCGMINTGSASSLVIAIYNNGGNETYTYLDDISLVAHEHTAADAVVENSTPTGYDSVVYCEECGMEISRNHVVVVPGNLSVATQRKGDEARLVIKLTGEAEAIEAYEDITVDYSLDGTEYSVSLDALYDSFINEDEVVSAASLSCTYIAILEIGDVQGVSTIVATASYTANGETVTGPTRTTNAGRVYQSWK